MTFFQIVAILFALFMMFWIWSSFKRDNLTRVELVLWLLVWTTFIILALFPNILSGVVDVLNFARTFDLLIVLAFMILTALVFYIYLRVKKIESKLEKLVRQIAIEELCQKKPKLKKK